MKPIKPLVALVIAAVLFGGFASLPSQAHAASPRIIKTTKAEDIAYNRCVKAAYAYSKKPEVIAVSIKDLKLTKKQVVDVETRLHSNGELWWINTFALGLSTKQITMPCKYSDAKITKMRKSFEKAVAKAMKRIGLGMVSSAKVHMLHDYLIKTVKYKDQCKNAYDALVRKRADCFGYTLATDVLLRRAGFSTDVAFNSNPDVDHSWNLVRIGKAWYHVDTTWDRYFTYDFYKGKKIYHKWLLQSDAVMNRDEHRGWEAHHRCSKNTYRDHVGTDAYFDQHCKDYKKIVRSFTRGGLRYVVSGVKRVYVSGVAKSYRSKRQLTIPARVTCKNVKYRVIGLQPKAFAVSKAKFLTIQSSAFTKKSVASSLAKSKVKTVFVPNKKHAAYKKYFAKSNAGKKVSVKKLSSSSKGMTSKTRLRAA